MWSNARWVVRLEANKPAKEQIAVQLFDQHSFRTDAIDRLQQQGQQSLLRRNRLEPTLGAKQGEDGVERIQHLIR